jgi:very-short-patch-repair endonuclease
MYERTNLEEIVAAELTRRQVPFIEQFPTETGFVLDFVVSPNIVIEADGPSHDGSRNKRRDWFRDKCLLNEGWKVFRIKYKAIEKPALLKIALDGILKARSLSGL